jgi:hypothetical protein
MEVAPALVCHRISYLQSYSVTCLVVLILHVPYNNYTHATNLCTKFYITVHTTVITVMRVGVRWCHHQGVPKQVLLIQNALRAIRRRSATVGTIWLSRENTPVYKSVSQVRSHAFDTWWFAINLRKDTFKMIFKNLLLASTVFTCLKHPLKHYKNVCRSEAPECSYNVVRSLVVLCKLTVVWTVLHNLAHEIGFLYVVTCFVS